MRKFYILVLAVFFVSSFSIAQSSSSEKELDKSDYIVTQKAGSQSGSLDASDPTYNRIFTADYSITCNATSSFSGSGVGIYYDVYEIHSPSGEAAVVSITSDGLGDSVLSLYCSFDPSDASANLVCYDDDGGAGLMSAFTPADNFLIEANTSYYLVVSSFSPSTGAYTLDLGGDLLFGGVAPPPVPLSNWIFMLIGVLAVTVVFFKFKK